MSTTALLVDILIIGIQVILWMMGFAFSFIFEPTYIKQLVNNSPTVFIFLFIVASYTMGIIADHIIGKIFTHFKPIEEKDLYNNVSIIEIVGSDIEIHRFLNNHYERLRIARGTLLNLPVITVSLCCFVYTNVIDMKICLCYSILLIFLSGALLTFLAYISWKSRNKTYIKYIEHAKKRLLPSQKPHS